MRELAVMNGLLVRKKGRLRVATTAIYAHLDDNGLQAAAEKAAGRIAKAIEFEAGT